MHQSDRLPKILLQIFCTRSLDHNNAYLLFGHVSSSAENPFALLFFMDVCFQYYTINPKLYLVSVCIWCLTLFTTFGGIEK
jgi:uncharacterized protein (DUF2225 family)